MTRRDAAEKVFNYIKKNQFKPINITYGNGYFIFDKGEDGVVHFQIKGLHGWKFAMWINTDPEELKDKNGKEYPAVYFFCQHKLNIDKFKPSRSHFCIEYSLRDIEDTTDCGLYEIREMLQMIKRHPLVSFAMDCNYSQYYNKSYIMCYLGMKMFRMKRKTKEWLLDTFTRVWHGSKVLFIKKYKVVDSVRFIDNNTNGWKCSPRYDMMIHFKKISGDEGIQEEAEIKMLDFWFRKNSYKNMHLDLTREGIDGRYCYPMVDGELNKLIKNTFDKMCKKIYNFKKER